MAEETDSVYFFGVWKAGEAGHYLYTPARWVGLPGFGRNNPTPFEDIEGLCWNSPQLERRGTSVWRKPQVGPQEQGAAALHHIAGWTALAWWDRTGDQRGGSVSVVIVDQVRTFEEMLALFASSFPAQAARQTAEIKLVRTYEGRRDANS